jgi:hypothetical protein
MHVHRLAQFRKNPQCSYSMSRYVYFSDKIKLSDGLKLFTINLKRVVSYFNINLCEKKLKCLIYDRKFQFISNPND